MTNDAKFAIADAASWLTADVWPWRRLADGSEPDIAALLIVTVGDDEPWLGPIRADMMFNITGELRGRMLAERPAAKAVYVIYWPGVLEIPWPEGMTAPEAVAAWKRESA